MKKLLFIVTNPAFFLSHRLPIALAAQKQGYEVAVAGMDGEATRTIRQYGLKHFVLPMNRSGKNPLVELQSIASMYRLMRSYRPDIVHLVTIKPVLYGGIAARLARVPGVVYAISGLGFVFTGSGSKLLRFVVQMLYRFSLRHRNSRVIVQNQDDCHLLRQNGGLRGEQVVLIRGSGVDLESHTVEKEPTKPPIRVTMAARLLKDKGVNEFTEAARICHEKGRNDIQWVLAGSLDEGNPASWNPQELDSAKQSIDYVGEVQDIAELYAQSHLVVLPSYREGLPKSLIEAAACGRAVITTDVPGCRDAIEPGKTGELVPVRNATALYEAVVKLADNDRLRQNYAIAGRLLAEKEFDIRHVVDQHLKIYQSLLER